MFLCLLFGLQDTKEAGLIAQLGNDDFYQCEAASLALQEKIDFACFKRLQKVKGAHKDPEVSYRIARLVDRYQNALRQTYQVDLRGYGAWPQIDEGLPRDYKLDGPWKGLNRWNIIYKYLTYAEAMGAKQDHFPRWTNYREATKIWMHERIDFHFLMAIENSNGEEFTCAMKKSMKAIQDDVDMLIAGDKAYYKKQKRPNPFEKKVEIQKEK